MISGIDLRARCPTLWRNCGPMSPLPYSRVASGKYLRQELDERAIGIMYDMVEECLVENKRELIEYGHLRYPP